MTLKEIIAAINKHCGTISFKRTFYELSYVIISK